MFKPRSLSFWLVLNFLIMVISLISLISQGDFSLGRRPFQNLKNTLQKFVNPSFLRVWSGNTKLEYKNEEGEILRTENQVELEKSFLMAVLRAGWLTFKMATIGSALACILGFILARPASVKLRFSKPIYYSAIGIINFLRSIHSLIFGLMLVGIVGLGPMAGILAIALHSTGSYGKLFSESIDSLDLVNAEALSLSGAGRIQVFFHGILPDLLPQFLSTHLYIWEFYLRDSAVLGLVGAVCFHLNYFLHQLSEKYKNPSVISTGVLIDDAFSFPQNTDQFWPVFFLKFEAIYPS